MKNNKKICILSTVNIIHMSLVSLYTDYFDKQGIEYDIIYIDKYGKKEPFSAKNVYRYETNNKTSRLSKIIRILRFRKYAKRILVNTKYDLIVVWNELTMIIFSKLLRKHYQNKYVLNVRDYGFNDYPILKRLTKKAIANSCFTMLSSDRFKEFLPKSDKYVFVHSYNKKIFTEDYIYNKKQNSPLTILFIGKLSYYEKSIDFIKCFKNNRNFELVFAGAGCDKLIPFVKGNGIENVFVLDAFPVSETMKHLKKADIIYNLYNKGTKAEDTALSIKLYYAINCVIPILTFKDTYTSNVAEKCGISITISETVFNNDLPKYVWDAYYRWDLYEAKRKCSKYMSIIRDSHNELTERLGNILLK